MGAESRAGEVERALAAAHQVYASELTLTECRRTLEGRSALGIDTAKARARLDLEAASWAVFPVDTLVLRVAERRWPVEPLRTLDALHLATALDLRGAGIDLAVLALDRRLIENALALGFQVVP